MKKLSAFAKKVDAVAKFFKGVTIVGGVLCVILLVVILGLKDDIYNTMEFSFSLSFVDFECTAACTPDVQTIKLYFIGVMILAIVMLALTYYEIVIICKIIKPMTEERPFDTSVAKNIRTLSWVILIGEGIFSLIDFALQIWQYHAFDYEKMFLSDKIISISADYDFDTTFIFVFLVIHLLSYVFQYGEELQIQSDETL